MCCNVFNVWPKKTLIPVWRRDAKTLASPASLACLELGAILASSAPVPRSPGPSQPCPRTVWLQECGEGCVLRPILSGIPAGSPEPAHIRTGQSFRACAPCNRGTWLCSASPAPPTCRVPPKVWATAGPIAPSVARLALSPVGRPHAHFGPGGLGTCCFLCSTITVTSGKSAKLHPPGRLISQPTLTTCSRECPKMPLRSLTSPRAAHEIFSAGYLASRSSLQQRCLWVGPADPPLT